MKTHLNQLIKVSPGRLEYPSGSFGLGCSETLEDSGPPGQSLDTPGLECPVCFGHACCWGTQFEQAEQADNMHSQNPELALRFHLWQERVVTEGKLLPNSQRQKLSNTAKIGGPNLQPETENTKMPVM